MSPVPPVAPITPVVTMPSTPNKSILVKLEPERHEVAASESASIFINCNLQAPSCDDSERKPIDVVVVLDRSGSMQGEKLDLCKKTMEFLSQQLTSSDRVSLVSYDSNVRTDMPLTKMNDNGKEKLADAVKNIRAGSCTNLSGGLLTGVDEIQKPHRQDGEEPNPVQSILMLTDGQANEGITSAEGLSKMLGGALSTNVSLHTFGYGSDHDAKLLGKLADIGHGSYYFVQNVDAVALAFADCLGGLLSVVAQSIKIEVVATPGVTISSIKSKRNVTTIIDKVHYEVEIGDLFAEEARDLMVEVQLTPIAVAAAQVDLVEFRVRYANVLLSSLERFESRATIGRPTTVTNFAVNENVMIQKQRIAAAEAIEAAAEAARMGNLEQGRQVLDQAISKARYETSNLSLKSQGQTDYLFDAYKNCQSNIASESVYKERGHGRMQQYVQSAWMQRENDIEVEECAIIQDLEGLSTMYEAPGLPPPQYGSAAANPIPPRKSRNVSQMKMLKKAFDLKKT